MKFNKQDYNFIAFLLGAMLMYSGCAKKTQDDPSQNIIPIPTPTFSPYITSDIPGAPGSTTGVYTDSDYSSGATATFNIVSSDEFNLFVGSHPVDPKNVVINVDLKQVPSHNTYAGTVKIHYNSNSQEYEANLESGTETYNGKDYFMYNYFFNYQSKSVFSGFFEDSYGAIVLIFNSSVDLGDGAGPSQLGGEVWYKNFDNNFSSYDAGAGWSVVLPCWFRSIGPYDCRSSSVINKSSLYPTDGYRKLGTFSNLNRVKALNLVN